MPHKTTLNLSLVLVALLPAIFVHAQGSDDSCPALVETALQQVGDACANLARDVACYGHTRVDAAFWKNTNNFTSF